MSGKHTYIFVVTNLQGGPKKYCEKKFGGNLVVGQEVTFKVNIGTLVSAYVRRVRHVIDKNISVAYCELVHGYEYERLNAHEGWYLDQAGAF